MRFLTTTGRRWRDRWQRAVGTTLTVVVLSAVVVMALNLFDSEVLATWKGAGDAESLASTDGFAGTLGL